jgi:two-component system NarL family response regulator
MSQEEKSRIMLVDDHELFRQGLASLINNQPDLQVVGQASDGLSALSLASKIKPDLIIMDVNMPISNGLEATQLIRQRMPDVRILMLTIHEDDHTLYQAIQAGANGYLLKQSDSASFLEGVRKALAGEPVLPPQLADRLLEEFARLASLERDESPKEDYGLTLRELEVLENVATGATDKEIAVELNISVYTVKSHVRNILSKLHAINRWQAVNLAQDKGMLDSSGP